LDFNDLENMPVGDEKVIIHCIDYAEEWQESREIELEQLDAFLASKRPEGTRVRWINVDGLSNPKIIQKFAEKYKLHPLAVEDVFHIPQRPKAETFPQTDDISARLYMVMQMLYVIDHQLYSEQVSLFLGHNTVLTFQQKPGDIWDAIRERIATGGSKLRKADASFLVYALLDAVIDHCFPILEQFSQRLEDLEEAVIEDTEKKIVNHIYRVKRELLMVNRQVWPMREVLRQLQHDDVTSELMSEQTRMYLRDVYDHAVQIIEIVETYRDLASGLADMHMTVVSNRMNEVMKVLTIFASIFIPITFIAGVYGMNFENIPELHVKWGYYGFWGICIAVGGGMLAMFRHKKWL
jgi:magnesium transporter